MRTRDFLNDLWLKVLSLKNFRMKDLRRLFVPGVAAGVLLILVVTGAYGLQKSRAFRRPVTPTRLEVIGFYENGSKAPFVSSEQSLRDHIDVLDTVVPFWASVDARGNITAARPNNTIRDFVHSHNIPVVILLNNVKQGTVSNVAMIETPEARSRAVQNIVAFVTLQQYDGAHISFDLLPPSARPAFSAFIEQLGQALHGANKILGVSVFPALELPASVSGAFDFKAIGRSADYVVLQAYERHWLNSGPGPVAPDPWVESSVQAALKDIPAKKLVLGIGAYGYAWPVTAGEAETEYLPATEAQARAAQVGARIKTDSRSNQQTYTYTISEVSRVVWFQDTASLRSKMNIAKKYGLRGVSLWRLGFETPDAWGVISQLANR